MTNRRDHRDLFGRLARAYLAVCWLPPVLYLLAWLAVRGTEGWGAWAAAPMLGVPVLLSLGTGVAGLVLIVMADRRGRPVTGLIAGTIISGAIGFGHLLSWLLRTWF
jgi:hypothetical protein